MTDNDFIFNVCDKLEDAVCGHCPIYLEEIMCGITLELLKRYGNTTDKKAGFP